jgi:hypothetical protein
MDVIRPSKAINRIILLQPGSSGSLVRTVLYESPNEHKKQTRILRPLERVVRRVSRAQLDYWGTLVSRHNRSNRKKRDGWIRDSVTNLAKASQKRAKQILRVF